MDTETDLRRYDLLIDGKRLPPGTGEYTVDINPATVTKLSDRGTFQTVGLVTDVEPFLRSLAAELVGQSAMEGAR